MIHLHLHSEYSIRDSLVKIDPLVEKIKEGKTRSVALTDHGSLSGALEFYLKCKENDIKPVIGMESYIVPDLTVKEKEKRFHLILLAKNETGYKNLIKLGSIAGTEGFYYVPRLDLKTIGRHKEGLIVLTACAYSSIVYLAGNDKISQMVQLLHNLFGNNLYLEIMLHDIEIQKKHNFILLEFSQNNNIPLAVTHDIHYLDQQDKEAHDILMKIQERDPYDVDDLFLIDTEFLIQKYEKDHQYILSEDFDLALKNTYNISDQVKDYNIPILEFEYPIFGTN